MARILEQQAWLTLCLAVVFCIRSSMANEPCTEVGRSCENSLCCSRCCTNGICLKSCAPQDNPCSRANCSGSEDCVLEQVTCIMAPCEPAPVCKSKDPCLTVSCESGSHCEAKEVQCIRAPCPPVAQCIPNADSDPCAVIRCRSGYRCERQCSTTSCRGACVLDDPCATVRCASGTHCESKQEQCSAPPCKPVAECVPDVNPCATVLCQTGTECVVQPGSNTASCIPIHSGRRCKSE